jgi:hypothetical protein
MSQLTIIIEELIHQVPSEKPTAWIGGSMTTMLTGAADDPGFRQSLALGLTRQTCDLTPFFLRASSLLLAALADEAVDTKSRQHTRIR